MALQKIAKIKEVYTSVDQDSIFSNCPFTIQKKHGVATIGINHWKVLRNFYRGSKTFGESDNLLELIRTSLTREEFETLKNGPIDIVATVSNLSLNQVEYKSIKEYGYEEFCEWIWISCNYAPFMSLVRKNGCEYADGGLGNMVPIEEAIKRGATEIDVIVLQTEVNHLNRMPSKNPFSLLTSIFEFILDRIEYQNIRIGKLVAGHHDAIINFYYTPTILTTNSLIFDKEKMTAWWESGYTYAKYKSWEVNQIEPEV